MSATQIRRAPAGLPGGDRYWEQVYASIREDRQARRLGDPGTFEGRRLIEARAYQRIVTMEDEGGHRATHQTLAGRQLRKLRAGLSTAGAPVPPQPAGRPVEHMTVPARISLR